MLTAIEKNNQAFEYSIPKTIGNVRRPFSVFLVDDDTLFLKSLEHHLQNKLKHNIKIITFSNGEECIKKLDQNPDVVILDYILNSQYPSSMNGIAVLRKIKQLKPDTYVIMVSGQDKLQVAVDTMKYGAYDYVIKNENAFLRVQNGIKNVLYGIVLTRELKNYKRLTKVSLSILALTVVVAICIQIFFPEYFHLGE